jgi:hypothetical protein
MDSDWPAGGPGFQHRSWRGAVTVSSSATALVGYPAVELLVEVERSRLPRWSIASWTAVSVGIETLRSNSTLEIVDADPVAGTQTLRSKTMTVCTNPHCSVDSEDRSHSSDLDCTYTDPLRLLRSLPPCYCC